VNASEECWEKCAEGRSLVADHDLVIWPAGFYMTLLTGFTKVQRISPFMLMLPLLNTVSFKHGERDKWHMFAKLIGCRELFCKRIERTFA
jgi:hypothetical protein